MFWHNTRCNVKTSSLVSVAVIVAIAATGAYASGPIGVYAIVEKVVFEPNEQAPERIQVWGAFAYADGGVAQGAGSSAVKKGYLYFSNPTRSEVILREWRDFKAVAGTGQAIGFGTWIYIGGFPKEPDQAPPNGIYHPRGGSPIDLRVHGETETPKSPAEYVANAGMVRLPNEGSHAAVVKLLRDALKK
jgi:hypothetical protein